MASKNTKSKEVAQVPEVMNTKLVKAEQKRLDELEIVIKANIQGFFKVGFALREIRESRLYREKYENWEDYCHENWDIGKVYANRMINAHGVVITIAQDQQIEIEPEDDLVPMGTIPKNERQARPLTELSPEAQIMVWKKVVETAPDGKITAAHVTKVAKEMVDGFKEKKSRKLTERIDKAEQYSKLFKSGFQTFLDVVYEARADNWKETSKKATLKHLDELRLIIEES